jgi:hypothetical protein
MGRPWSIYIRKLDQELSRRRNYMTHFAACFLNRFKVSFLKKC